MIRILLAVVFALCLVGSQAAVAGPACVDVEKATAKEMEALKGVGPALAKAIVDHRKVNRTAATKAKKSTWNFRNWAALLKVKGLGPKICTDNIATVCFTGKPQKACPK